MPRHATLALALALPLLAMACATATPRKLSGPAVSREDLKYRVLYIEPFTITPAGVKEEDPKPALTEAQAMCVKLLSESNLFDAVRVGASERPDPGLVVRAELASLRIVGGGTRFFVGAWAGDSDMRFYVSATDSVTGATVGKSEVSENGDAWAGAWTIGGTDSSLPEAVGTRVASYVLFTARK